MEVGMACQVKRIQRLEELSIRLAQKHPDFHLLSQIKQRLETLPTSSHLNSEITQAIAVSLQSPPYLDGLQEKDPPFQAWKQASYQFLCQEFGKENLVYLHLSQDKPIAAMHCIFVPIQSNQLVPQTFVGDLAHQQGYLNRYQVVLDRLFTQAPYQANGLPARQAPRVIQHKRPADVPAYPSFYKLIKNGLAFIKNGLVGIKNNNLPNYQKHNYQENKKNSSQNWPVLDHRQGTSRPLVHQGKGIYSYESLSNKQNNWAITDRTLNKGHESFGKVVTKVPGKPLSDSVSNPIFNQRQRSDEPIKDPVHQQKLAQYKLDKFPKIFGKTYLEKRGIEPATYQGIREVKTNPQGAIFDLYTVDIQGQARLCSTIQYHLQADGSSSKYFQKGLPRGLSVLKPNKPLKEIVIARSPIDALSHKQLHVAEHTLYISTCGSIGQGIARSLEAIFLQAKAQSIGVKLCFDQDEEGRKMAQQVSAIANKQGIVCQVEWPGKGKDWNDELLASKAAQLDRPRPAIAFGRSL